MASLLEVSGLTTHLRRREGTVLAVDGLNLAVEAGEMVALVGQAGCGKTITGLSIMQLLPPGGRIAAGRIRFAGEELVGLDERALRHLRGDRIAMIFQDPANSLNPTMTVGEQIVEAVRVHRRVSRREALDRAQEVLAISGVRDSAQRLREYPHQLSGGTLERVLLAMAIACQPELLIADEPTAALEPTLRSQVMELLASLQQQFRMAVLLLTRDQALAVASSDRVQRMSRGRVVDDSAPGDDPQADLKPGPKPLPLSAWGLK